MCTPLVDAAGVAFFVASTPTEQVLHAVDANGAPRWSVTVARGSFGSWAPQPALDKDGTLYVVSSDAVLHAFAP